jgi:hypothetical protein
VGSFRSFSSEHRREETVVAGPGIKTKYYIFFDYLALPEPGGKVLQAEYLYAKKIWDFFKNKIYRASTKIQIAFSIQNFYAMFINLNYVLDVQISQGYNRNNLIILLSDPCYLIYCFSLMKQNASYGSDFIPIGNVTFPAIRNLSLKIRRDSYKPSLIRRIYIPKSNGQMRPLGIASATDKILQKGILIIMERIFEPTFENISHGFRLDKSCHSALHSIYYRWPGTKWFIEADFLQCFDRISHDKLLLAINRKIHCYKFLALINQLLKVGYINFADLANSELKNLEGIPQGSLLSPLFCNILLNDLDLFVIKLCNDIFVERIKANSAD